MSPEMRVRGLLLFQQPDNKKGSDSDISVMVNESGTTKTVSGGVCPRLIMPKIKIRTRQIEDNQAINRDSSGLKKSP